MLDNKDNFNLVKEMETVDNLDNFHQVKEMEILLEVYHSNQIHKD